MAVKLRPMQTVVKTAIIAAWLGGMANVLAVAPTGSGKTVLFSSIISDEPGPVCVVAHRHELVSQISLALARNGIRHRIIGSTELSRDCTAAHMEELKHNFVDPNSRVAAASVDTLRGKTFKTNAHNIAWCNTVKLWVMDEAHHVQQENKWGDAVNMFPNARGLGVTADTERADGGGLGAWNDGVFHYMVEAPGMREHINAGYLTDYEVYIPPNKLNLANVDITPGGDFSQKKLAVETKRAQITGDIVAHYLRIAPGKLGITFAVDIEDATNIAAAYRKAGVPAEVVSSKTPSRLRRDILRRFRKREILQLVNVDLFGEGFDLPAIEVVSMGRATASWQLFKQQFGRVLRLLEGKRWGIVIDHVGNVMRPGFGLPDKPRRQTLERRDRRAKSAPDENLIPMVGCIMCTKGYERTYAACPHCGHERVVMGRSGPEFVDGDLMKLTNEVLAAMRGEIDKPPVYPYNADQMTKDRLRRIHGEKCAAQDALRATISLWAGWHKAEGRDDSYIYRLFYLIYGIDILGAQALNAKDAEALQAKLQVRLDAVGIVAA